METEMGMEMATPAVATVMAMETAMGMEMATPAVATVMAMETAMGMEMATPAVATVMATGMEMVTATEMVMATATEMAIAVMELVIVQTATRNNCDGYGSICYDPRFIGGDGVMFYFHGGKRGNFAIVSDDNLQINAHFIGTRPQGRTHDFTWIQAISVMFDTHTLVIAAKRVSKWDDKVDALMVKWDGEAINIPTNGEAEWRTSDEDREVIVERTDDTNYVRVIVTGIVDIAIRVRPIGEKEDRVHHYHIPGDDTFAHLETQFSFSNLSALVEGVLGKTYRPCYVSPVKRGVSNATDGWGGQIQNSITLLTSLQGLQVPNYYSICRACNYKWRTR
ncbi:unnamed protein product [Prunus brigantina]